MNLGGQESIEGPLLRLRAVRSATLVVFLLWVPIAVADSVVDSADPVGDEENGYTPSRPVNALLPCHDPRIDFTFASARSDGEVLTLIIDMLDPAGTPACGPAPLIVEGRSPPVIGVPRTILLGSLAPLGPAPYVAVEFRSDDHGAGCAGVFGWNGSALERASCAGTITPTGSGYLIEVPLESIASSGATLDLRERSYRLHMEAGSGTNPGIVNWIEDFHGIPRVDL